MGGKWHCLDGSLWEVLTILAASALATSLVLSASVVAAFSLALVLRVSSLLPRMETRRIVRVEYTTGNMPYVPIYTNAMLLNCEDPGIDVQVEYRKQGPLAGNAGIPIERFLLFQRLPVRRQRVCRP